ncbi:MAG: hypothetical protein MZV63_37580 [Marinilabiliales bacterium]|nr:hypothetical protein [Marinilabiliales bacterium]
MRCWASIVSQLRTDEAHAPRSMTSSGMCWRATKTTAAWSGVEICRGLLAASRRRIPERSRRYSATSTEFIVKQ